MKKIGILSLLFIVAGLIVLGFLLPSEKTHTEYLRIHIRADSNSPDDQAVKLKVRDKVVEFITPKIADCDSKEKAEKVIRDNLTGIEEVCDNVLSENNFDYKSTARVNEEKFPTRTYQSLTLESGYYDALIIELGSGSGDNWWCVVYPPLCFTTGNVKYEYKSKLLEIIDKFFKVHNKEKV